MFSFCLVSGGKCDSWVTEERRGAGDQETRGKSFMENVFFLFKYTHFSFKSNIQHSSVIYTDVFVLIRIFFFFSVFVVVLNETMEHLPVMYFCLSKLTDFNKRKVFHQHSLPSLSCQIESMKTEINNLEVQVRGQKKRGSSDIGFY